MRRQFAYHLDRIENIIGKMNARGDEFFEDTIRIGRVFDLMNKDKIKAEFERKVVGDTEAEIDATVNELIDWMVEQDLRTWEAINDYLDRRRLTQYEDQMVGEVSSQFRYDRRALLDSVSKRAQEEVDRYDPEQSANDLVALGAQRGRADGHRRGRRDRARAHWSSRRPARSRSMSPASWPPACWPVWDSSSCRASAGKPAKNSASARASWSKTWSRS